MPRKQLEASRRYLRYYTVYHHHRNKEYITDIVATSKLEASEKVKGLVMDVQESRDTIMELQEGQSYKCTQGSSIGWCKYYKEPTYKEQSPEWVKYLKSINLEQGLED